jgi:hypothetical protein
MRQSTAARPLCDGSSLWRSRRGARPQQVQATRTAGAIITAWFAHSQVSPTILTKVEPAQSLRGLGAPVKPSLAHY